MQFMTSSKREVVDGDQSNSKVKATSPRNTRVLIVEDSSNDTLLAWQALEAFGIREWHSVKTAEDAILFLQQRNCQIALVDYNLPRMNGLELLNILREEYPLMRVILVTGVRDELIAVNAMKSGAFDYVCKDEFLTSGIVKSIQAALNDIQLGRKATRAADSEIDEAMLDTEWLLETTVDAYKTNGTSPGPTAIGMSSEIGRATELYLKSAWFPSIDEDSLIQLLLRDTITPHELIMNWRNALTSAREEVLPFNPTLLLAYLLKRLVEHYQKLDATPVAE